MVACYVRVSTQEQANEGYSISEQTDRLKKYADAMRWQIFKVYTDGGFSGANIYRPALQEMIRDIEAGLIDKVLVYKLDRLSRSQKDTLFLIDDVFLKNGCDFVSMNENFDTSTPFGRAMIGILSVFAQLEREQIKERMAMGIEARAKEGLYNGSNYSAIGYDYIDGQLVINDFEAIQVKMIFEMYANGYSCNRITQYLNEKGYSHKYGTWNRKTVLRVLERKTYYGVIEYKGNDYQGQHEPIISKELFDICQRKHKATKEIYMEHMQGKNFNSCLSGLLVCARCGANFSKNTKHTNYKGISKSYYYYVCNSKQKKNPSTIKDPTCQNKSWRMETLDDLIFDEIKKLSLDPDYITQLQPTKKKDDRPKEFDKKIAEIEKQLSKLLELYSLDGISLEALQKKINELNTNKLKLSEEKTRILLDEEQELTKDEALRLINSFDATLEAGSMSEIRAILQALIDKIEIDGDDITIFWKFT